SENLVHRALEQLASMEPVVKIAKAVDSVFRRQFRLRSPRLGQSQIIKPQIRRQVRLVMPREEGLRSYDIDPLCKALPPPVVVFRNRMELWQVKCDGAHGFAGSTVAVAEWHGRTWRAVDHRSLSAD